MSHLEKEIERKCLRIAERNDCLLLKIVSPNRVGVPDRLFLGPHINFEPQIIWMEFKQRKGKPTPPQKRTLSLLASYGHDCHVVKSVEKFLEVTGLTE